MFISTLLLSAAVLAGADYVTPEQEKQAFDKIRESLPEKSTESVQQCTISPTESCDIGSFEPNKSVQIFPGGETRCIYSYSSPYSFQVIPGEKNNLLFYFQGGGACWTDVTTNLVSLCSTDANPSGYNGVFDRDNVLNPYQNYTVVQVLYCSGDVHGGNVTRSYSDRKGVPIQQKGYQNTMAVLAWLKGQQRKGALNFFFDNVVISGQSAGAIGAQFWSNYLSSQLLSARKAVIADSFVALFPPGTQGPVIKDFGMCNSNILSPDLLQTCEDGNFSLQELMNVYIAAHPRVPFTYIQSKVDEVQYSYYMAVAASARVKVFISPNQFYREAADILIQYSQAFANVLTYLVSGDQHTYTPLSLMYTTTPTGTGKRKQDSSNAEEDSEEDSNEEDSSEEDSETEAERGGLVRGTPLVQWLAGQPVVPGSTLLSICEGRRLKQARIRDHQRNRYCPAELSPKIYRQG